MSAARPLAFLLLRHARWIMPERRAAWAEAMERETRHIADDREAMRWAIGCVFAAYADRVQAEQLLAPRAARLLLAAWCLQFPLFHFQGLYLQMLSGGPILPGSAQDYELFALQVLGGMAAFLYLLAGMKLACNRQNAMLPYSAALLISFAAFGHMVPFLQHAGGQFVLNLLAGATFAIGDLQVSLRGLEPNFWFGIGLPVALGLAIWAMDHYPDDTPAPRRLV